MNSKEMHRQTQASFFNEVYKAVRSIPEGTVATYGSIARAVGRPTLARYVGYALHQNPSSNKNPCHRVVFKDGRLSPSYAFGGEGKQRAKLKKEGVTFLKDGRVRMKTHYLQ